MTILSNQSTCKQMMISSYQQLLIKVERLSLNTAWRCINKIMYKWPHKRGSLQRDFDKSYQHGIMEKNQYINNQGLNLWNIHVYLERLAVWLISLYWSAYLKIATWNTDDTLIHTCIHTHKIFWLNIKHCLFSSWLSKKKKKLNAHKHIYLHYLKTLSFQLK